MAGDHALVLVCGAAGAGNTTTLATARAALARDGSAGGHQMLVVTPTLKAARGARAETGAHTGSAAWLVVQHGWRWADDTGAWTRLAPGDLDPRTGTTYRGPSAEAQLRLGDLLVVDEAGMLDQDTARALLTVADEHQVRVALVGDRHQLAAIGRGGVLDLASRWADRAVTLDVIHRFTRLAEIEPGVLASVADLDYAALSLRMREGAAGDPAAVFDELAARGQVHVHTSVEELRHHVAAQAAAEHRAGRAAAVSVATNEAAGQLNAAIRGQLVATGNVDDGHTGAAVATTSAGQRIGAGDLVASRSNDRDLDVANRDIWTVVTVHPDGALTITGTASTAAANGGQRTLPAGYVNRHVELAYATTIHGVQGETATTGHLVLDEQTSASAAYVGMTRGRTANTVHLVADDLAAARQQWIDAAGRGWADLGVEAARAAAERAGTQYASAARRPDVAQQLARVLEQLRDAWTAQADAATQLRRLEPRLARATADAERHAAIEAELAPLRDQAATARAAADASAVSAERARAVLTQRAEQMQAELHTNWDQDRPAARDAARILLTGPGKFGRLTGGRAAVAANQDFLDQWADKWRPVIPELTNPAATARYAGRHPGNDHIDDALHEYVSDRVAAEMPREIETFRAAQHAFQIAEDAARRYTQALSRTRHDEARGHAAGWRDLAEELPRLNEQTTAARDQLQRAEHRLNRLATDAAVTSQPDPAGWLATAHGRWGADRRAALTVAANRAAAAARRAVEAAAQARMHSHQHDQPYYGPTADRGGPSIGR